MSEQYWGCLDKMSEVNFSPAETLGLFTQVLLHVCMLGNVSYFCCPQLTFFKINLFKNSFRKTIRVLSSLDSGQKRHSFSPDLCPNCL